MIYRYNQPKPVGPLYDYHCPVSGCPKRVRQITGPIKCPIHRGQMVEDSPAVYVCLAEPGCEEVLMLASRRTCPQHPGLWMTPLRAVELANQGDLSGLRKMDEEDMNRRIDAFEALFKAKTSRWWRRG